LVHTLEKKYREIELMVSHDGKQWFAKNNSVEFKATELFELEGKIEQAFRQSLKKNEQSQLKVFLRFDFNNFPKWLHQYHSHYFNRTLILSS
tara:strand:+ start:180 stop:455 length:276 start_codon:yes stop_codon:yes gene_type:complete